MTDNKSQQSRITFLGTGTSQGVPMIGCNCHVCQSSDPKDKRLRTSALIEHHGFRLLIDCGPDFRQQMLRENITDLDAILLTHQHKDHTGGLDDIRAFNYFRQKRFESQAANAKNGSFNTFAQEVAFPIYAEERVQEGLKKEFYYAFEEFKYPGVPDYNLITITDKPFKITKSAAHTTGGIFQPESHIKKLEITPIRVMHYKLPILGFRVGNLAYITDGSCIPEPEFEKLKGLDVLVINTVRHTKHISHFSLPEALEIIRKVGAPRNYLTHLSHSLGTYTELTAELNRQFPATGQKNGQQVYAAHDGLKVEF